MTLQGDLFGQATSPVGGLSTFPGAIPDREEQRLQALVDACPLEPFRFGQWRARRLTASFGSGYDYARGRIVEAPPIPGWLLELRAGLARLAGMDAETLRQALVIRYDPGAGIGWHRDRPQYGQVMGLSLGAPAVLRLRRRRPEGGFERRSVHLPPRSVYLLGGEVRHEWEHSIAPMDAVRRSVTFRTLR